MTEWKPGDTAPFLMLSRKLGLPYSKILLAAEWAEGRGSSYSPEHSAALAMNENQWGEICALVTAEYRRRRITS